MKVTMISKPIRSKSHHKRHERIDFLSNKKALSVWKLASTKREDYKKLLHKKFPPYRCAVVARSTCIIPLWNGSHMWGRCLGFFFQILYYYGPSAPAPTFTPQHPSVQSRTPFCRYNTSVLTCFLIISKFTCCWCFELRIATRSWVFKVARFLHSVFVLATRNISALLEQVFFLCFLVFPFSFRFSYLHNEIRDQVIDVEINRLLMCNDLL